MKTLVQCDFDGTITEKDVSFALLDAFAQGDWHSWLRKYKQHKISVGQFNIQVFSMIKADETTLLKFIKGKVKIRTGFRELVNYCSRRGIRLVIVSNGLDFYIKAILKELGLEEIEFHAARTFFDSQGLKIRYIGPDGKELDSNFKEAYLSLFLGQGYRVVYVGDGDSDISPARQAYQILARGELLTYCRENGLECKPFDDFADVIRSLELLKVHSKRSAKEEEEKV